MTRVKLIILLLLFAIANLLFAKEFYNRFGYNGGYNLNIHTASFKALPGIPNCCPNFENGLGHAYSFGYLFEISLKNVGVKSFELLDNFSFEGRMSAMALDAELIYNENVIINLTGIDEPGEIEHSLKAEYLTFGFEPYINYYLTDKLSLSFGGRFAGIIRTEFSQKETLIKPVGRGYFTETGTRVRNDTSGLIPNRNDELYFISAGISYSLPLNKEGTISIIPEIFYYYPLNSLNEILDWHAQSIRIGFTIALTSYNQPKEYYYEFVNKIDTLISYKAGLNERYITNGQSIMLYDTNFKSYKITEMMSRTDTLFLPRVSKLEAYLTASADEEHPETALEKITIDEFELKNNVPILNYIFFDNNSASIPSRYQLIKKEHLDLFSVDSMIYLSTMEMYYHILNVIGYRMKEKPDSRITITGFNSGESESGSIKLSEERAISVSKYLEDIWDVPKSRINIKYKNLPEEMSDNQTVDGQQENQRVEINSDDNRILAPVVLNQKYITYSPKSIYFYHKVVADTIIDYNRIFMKGAFFVIIQISGVKSGKVKFDLNKDILSNTRASEEQYFLVSKDETGHIDTSDIGKIHIERTNRGKIIDEDGVKKKVENYKMILFSYNKPDINSENLEIINFIKQRLKSDDEIIITGYTDRTGDSQYNLELSEQRAKNTANVLNMSNIKIISLGENEILFNNNLPEGRFYSRTVDVLVKTPIK